MASHGVIQILNKASATGSAVNWLGGRGVYIVRADTWNGAVATLQRLTPDHDAWVSLGSAGALTADGIVGFECAGTPMRVLITGSPTNVSAWLEGTEVS